MGTKPAPLNAGDRMWLRQNGAMLRPGQACWVLAQVDKPGLCVQIHMDDGSGRPRDIQLADPAGTRRWVARGQLVAFGTATWFRESHRAAADARAAGEKAAALSLADRGQAFLARQAALELEQLQASRRAAAEASQAETVARAAMDAAAKNWHVDPATYQQARAAHDAAWAKSNELAMRLPIMWVDDGAGGYRHLTEAEAAHQHWLDEFARTAAALEVPDGTQV